MQVDFYRNNNVLELVCCIYILWYNYSAVVLNDI